MGCKIIHIILGCTMCLFFCTAAEFKVLPATDQKTMSIEQARELKHLFCESQIVGKEETFQNVPLLVDSFYVFPGSFFLSKKTSIKNGLWINYSTGMVYNGQKNIRNGNGWAPNK